MTMTQEESYILGKIGTLAKQLHEYFEEIGLSRKEIALFFARRIFSVDLNPSSLTGVSGNILKTHLTEWLRIGEQKYGSLKSALTKILINLQIEKGAMEEYERFEPQALVKSENRYESHDLWREEPRLSSRRLATNCSIKDSCEEIDQCSRIMTDLKHIRNFERELSDSMRKTRLLKKMIQQKIMEEAGDSYSQRIRHIQSLLALETSG